MKLILLTIALASQAHAGIELCGLDNHFVDANKMLWALAQIESGGNDYAHGRHGEVSRYQCMKRVWRNATAQPYSAATNAQIAATVTLAVIRARTGQDPATLTPAAFALAWHCPNSKHLNAEQRDYVDRFTNLVRK